ncbi:hypothetical protein [Defluviimonas sp. SAOS-178_SWC]|uniref:hypothetical protein n=1 Tax=Defluviimonas sp. SAOS-178_SWC TaxID=3121287 RepID=UPI003221A53F
MKRIASAFAVMVIVGLPAVAQDKEATPEDGFSLLEEGAKIILRSMIDEVEPTLKDLQKDFGEAMDEMGPALGQLVEMIGDIRNYHAPEMLPNGDIIIRRKTPDELAAPKPGEEIEI